MFKAHSFARLPIAVMAFIVLSALFATAPMDARADNEDQERARQAMLSGEVRPLSELLERVESTYAGDIIEVELEEDDDGAWLGPDGGAVFLYEIKLLTPQGNLVKLEYNAKNLELLTVDGHDSESALKDSDDNDD